MNSPENQSNITPEILRDHGISQDEYQRILKWLGRTPTTIIMESRGPPGAPELYNTSDK